MYLKKWQEKFDNFKILPIFFKIQRLLEKIPFKPVRISRFFMLSLDAFPQVNYIRGVRTIRMANPEDIPALFLLKNKPELFSDRLDRGEHCVVAIDKNAIVGYEWFSSAKSYLEERYRYKITIPRDTVYAYDAYIRKDYRLRGIWVQFKLFMKEWMDTANRQKIVTMIDYDNNLSFKTHIRFGFKICHDIFMINIFGKSFFIGRNQSSTQTWESTGYEGQKR